MMSDVVQDQYERWVYPEPILDLEAPQHRGMLDGSDPWLLGQAYWPDRPPRHGLHILVAGCGSNAAARYAFNHRDATVVGIDISAASLKHERFLKAKHGLDNLTLCQCRIEDVHELEQTFDLIDTTGVLHHTTDPSVGLKALAGALRRDGVIYIMLYGKYGRSGVYMAQEIFRMIELDQSPESVAIAKQALTAFKADHPVRRYTATATDLAYDAGVVDTFLHGRDQAFTVEGCLRVVRSAGLAFQGWLSNFHYYPDAQIPDSHPLRERMRQMPDERVWQIMELFHGLLPKHDFYACRADRDRATYHVDFNGNSILDMVPILRPMASLARQGDGSLKLTNPLPPTLTFTGSAMDFMAKVDGKRALREYGPHGVDLARALWRMSAIFIVHRSAVA